MAQTCSSAGCKQEQMNQHHKQQKDQIHTDGEESDPQPEHLAYDADEEQTVKEGEYEEEEWSGYEEEGVRKNRLAMYLTTLHPGNRTRGQMEANKRNRYCWTYSLRQYVEGNY